MSPLLENGGEASVTVSISRAQGRFCYVPSEARLQKARQRPPGSLLGCLRFSFLRFCLFDRELERERQRDRERGKQAPRREPDVGLDPGLQGQALG